MKYNQEKDLTERTLLAKALVLVSGGLDSLLSVKILDLQGIDLEMVNFQSIFTPRKPPGADRRALKRFSAKTNVPLLQPSKNDLMLEVLENPAHGYGKNMNPCIDCRIAMLRRAGEMMKQRGADFLATGEVVGQRPMSQRRHAMNIIDEKTGLSELIVRPLSAKVLAPTIPETKGWVDRERLYGITGRSRKEQMRLAEELGVDEYPSPGGGCLLTFPDFSSKARDLADHGDWALRSFHLLKMGRHFRLSESTKAVVGRNHGDNVEIASFANPGDILLAAADFNGPTTLVYGNPTREDLELAGQITLRYTKAPGDKISEVRVLDFQGNPLRALSLKPAPDIMVKELLIERDK